MIALAAALCAALSPLEAREAELREARERLLLVEREYGGAEDPSETLRLRRAFADGETHYLLGEYEAAAALLADVAADRKAENWADGVRYLADSLFRLQNWPEARRLYGLLAAAPKLAPRDRHDAVLRLFELSEKTLDFAGVEEAFGKLEPPRPEAVYQHARWLARRDDPRALEAFRAIPDGGDFGPQARYFEGALLVQRGALPDAARAFEKVLRLVKDAPTASQLDDVKREGVEAVRAERARRDSRIRDQALLALGRIFFEQGRYGPAIDRYRDIEKESEAYGEALSEQAACWLKLGEFQRALQATGLWLALVEDSPDASEARLLQANLYLRLKNYLGAEKEFEALADKYQPVEEKIVALTRREDPVAYYDQLFQSGDAVDLLPDAARRYAAGREVVRARGILGELAGGRREIDESLAILKRLDAAVAQEKLDLFPMLQEGNARAVEVENALLRIDGELAASLESAAPQHREALERAGAAVRAASLPESDAQIEARRQPLLARVFELAKTASRLGGEIENIQAQLRAAAAWQKETRAQRHAPEQAEREFAAQLERDRAAAGQLEEERQDFLRLLDVARVQSAAAAAGGQREDRVRAELVRALDDAVAKAAATLGPEGKALFSRIAAGQAQVRDARARVQRVRAAIRQRTAAKMLALRGRVDNERRQLAAHQKAAADLEGGTRQLLGRIAWQSFARVERQLHELVLKAQLGIIDAAWTQKKDRSDSITALENERRAQLKALQDDLK